MSDMWNERMRLIRFRRKRERAKFTEELRIIPKWLVWTCVALWLVALIIGLSINLHNIGTHEGIFPDDSFRDQPVLASLALAGVITAVAFLMSVMFFTLGYVYRDAKRRGMHPALWTILVLILSGGYFFIGLIIYLLVREPLPFTCPQCAATVSARYNFCPNCKYNLHPACPHCQHEVSDSDKFCPFCAAELAPPNPPSAPTPTDSAS